MNVFCFGDSNTFGYDPRGYFGGRYAEPWPQVLAERTGWSIENQGENGREIPRISINIPKETDLFIIMLGTNDLLQGHSVNTASERMEVFLNGIDPDKSRLLLIAPPPMELGAWVPTESLADQSKELVQAYQMLSRRLGVRFVNAGEWNIPLAFDGVHFTEEGHMVFADRLLRYLTKEGY